ncbi:hypothetical protein FJU10_12705 [Enterococcus sp. OL5]|nr:hypothetical protein FJU10_12705 [Enterococcus sp. OL5]
MWPFKKRQLNSTSIGNDTIKENELFEHKKYINELVNYQHSLEEEIATLEREAKESLSEISVAIDNSLKKIKVIIEEEKQLKKILIKNEMEILDQSTGLEFENEIAKILHLVGFEEVSVSKGSGDQGIDIFAKKDGEKFGIQCKKYSSSVGNKAVQEVISGKEFFNLDKAIVITNSSFTTSATELAFKANVTLWNRMNLEQIISENLIDKRIGSILVTLSEENIAVTESELPNNFANNSQSTTNTKPLDELFEEAKEIVVEMQTASVSLIQRRFRISYNRAAQLVDELEVQGVVGPSEGSKPRRVLIEQQAESLSILDELKLQRKRLIK